MRLRTANNRKRRKARLPKRHWDILMARVWQDVANDLAIFGTAVTLNGRRIPPEEFVATSHEGLNRV